MTRNYTTFTKLLVCAMIMGIMAFFALPAIAAGSGFSQGTDSNSPAGLALTKIIKMPINTPTPESNFFFHYRPTSFNYDNSVKTQLAMPTLNNEILYFNYDEKPVGGTFNINGSKYVVKESSNVLANKIGSFWNMGAGIYIYDVYEFRGTFTLLGAVNEGKECSKADYSIEIWVEKDSNGILFPKYVYAKIIHNINISPDEYYEGYKDGEKVDPTPGGSKPDPNNPTIEGNFSQMIFTNKYWRSDGPGILEPNPDPDDSALNILKVIDGPGADKSTLFPFNVTVTQPDVVKAPQTYDAKIMQKVTNPVTGATTLADVTYGINNALVNKGFISFPSGVKVSGIMLTNNQQLVFVNLHIGSTVEVEETTTSDYMPSYIRTFDSIGKVTGQVNSTFGFGAAYAADPGPCYTMAGKGVNNATFTNTRLGASPTGINVDNLPYAVIMGLALAGLVGYVAVRTYKGANR